MPKQKILLMYITVNSGHHCASIALEKALLKCNPSLEILNINSFNYTNPILEKVINAAYMGVIKGKPEVWDYLYDNPKVVKRTRKLRDLIHRINAVKIKTLMDEFQPDAVACTQAFPCGLVSDYKLTIGSRVPLFGVVTDYIPHSYWMHDHVNSYIVGSEKTKEWFVKRGIPAERVNVFGIPINPEFAEKANSASVYRELNLDPANPVVLLMGGGQGLGPLKNTVDILGEIDLPLQTILVTGTNNSLRKWAEKRKDKYRNRLVVLGYANNIDKLMGASTVIITKPGGLTTAEALAKGLPIIILNPLPGQEAKNTHFLLEEGLALKVEDEESLPPLIKKLWANPALLSQIRDKNRSYGKPKSAQMTARLILDE
jgi:processive 1,2-diacylglycerol beta-glucosyltransferase